MQLPRMIKRLPRTIKSLSGKRLQRAKDLSEKVHNTPFDSKSRYQQLLTREGKLNRISEDISKKRKTGMVIGGTAVGSYGAGELDKGGKNDV